MFTRAVDAYVRSVDDVRKLQDDWAKNDRGSISGPVIEFFGRTHLPPHSNYERFYSAARQARRSIAAAPIDVAADDVRTAEDLQRKAWDEWSEYIDRYASGAGRTATGLEFGRDTCFTVAAALATGGVASGVGAGLVRRALIEAGMQTAGQVIGQGTTHEMARIEGVADDDSFTKILERAGIGAVSSLAGSLVGGKLAPKFAPGFRAA